MQKSKRYKRVRFSAEVIQAALEVFTETVPPDAQINTTSRTVDNGQEEWTFDTDEEFLAAYRKGAKKYRFQKSASLKGQIASLMVGAFSADDVHISVSNAQPLSIEKVFNVFERNLETSRLNPLAPQGPNVAKSKSYKRVRFSAEVIQAALEVFTETVPPDAQIDTTSRTVDSGQEEWTFDTDEEFLAAYRKGAKGYRFQKSVWLESRSARFTVISSGFGEVNISVSNALPSLVEKVFNVFERNLETSRLPPPLQPVAASPVPTIFIGHGQSDQWRELKDHLTDKHNYRVIAYEVGARAGHTIRDILDEMLTVSSFALLVMTGDDETDVGQLRARQNVVHELGLFQGKLGFHRAIAVAEHGVELFSNIDGVQQLHFSSGNIAEIYGDVLATLRREFGDAR